MRRIKFYLSAGLLILALTSCATNAPWYVNETGDLYGCGDGSYGQKGVVTVGIEQVILREQVDKVFAIGPAIMMKFCCLLTKKYNHLFVIFLNSTNI